MKASAKHNLRQRSDYTHKFNAKAGRHGWLRLTPAYSVKIVEEIMGGHQEKKRILDPFCGTATTALSAACHGHEGVTIDINPFLVWFGQTKTARYSNTDIDSARNACSRIIKAIKNGDVNLADAPSMHNIERWWSTGSLVFLRTLKAAIKTESAENSPEKNLLLVAFCKTLMELSNAAFNHQSISFKDDRQAAIPVAEDMPKVFSDNLAFILEGAGDSPDGMASVVLGDARSVSESVEGPFDVVITSPPYANRMSYIRELRPYMYWLGFLNNAHDAGKLDWSAIGGTWGVATSRLNDWRSQENPFRNSLLESVVGKISGSGNRSGKLLGNYVARYFDDIWQHFDSLRAVLGENCELHYIVGNSTFYGVLLPVEKIYAEILDRLGFENIECRAIRKRNSKKELLEFDISAFWRERRSLKEAA